MCSFDTKAVNDNNLKILYTQQQGFQSINVIRNVQHSFTESGNLLTICKTQCVLRDKEDSWGYRRLVHQQEADNQLLNSNRL